MPNFYNPEIQERRWEEILTKEWEKSHTPPEKDPTEPPTLKSPISKDPSDTESNERLGVVSVAEVPRLGTAQVLKMGTLRQAITLVTRKETLAEIEWEG